MLTIRNHFALALIAFAGWALVAMPPAAGQQPAGGAGPFTAAQAGAGATAYQANCATCHQPDLRGQGTAAPLAGQAFIGAWGSRPASELLSFMQLTMPPGSPGTLSADTYSNIAAFILQSNGARAGNQPLTANTQVLINAVATGQAAAAAGRSAPPPAAPAGITVAGEVRNYVPVTDAMLRNPDPGDWLMIRRDYRASNYSPLSQITRDNVKNLRLVWSWAMNEGGTNQPAPLVHNGIIYLNNPGNIIQALDGKTGDVIWENRYGTNAAGAAMRGIALY